MAKEAILYPDLPNTPANDPSVTRTAFWRAAWLRDLAEHEALQRLMAKQYALKRPDHVTQMALVGALQHSAAELQHSFKTLVDAGGLLLAWAPDAPRAGAKATRSRS